VTEPALQYPLTIFYDGSCTLCAGEMTALKKLDRDGRLELVDCSRADFDGHGLAVGRAAMMSRIHARDADGRWLKGIDVFEAAYAAAGLDLAARLWGNRLLRPLWEFLYPHIADNRQLLSRLGFTRLVRWAIPKPESRCPCDGHCATAPNLPGGRGRAR
jgi:predicted DCC family thiol-disulfide oxidoreductase YuxK